MQIALLSVALYSEADWARHSSDNKDGPQRKNNPPQKKKCGLYWKKKTSIQSQQIHNRGAAVGVLPTQSGRGTLWTSLPGDSL